MKYNKIIESNESNKNSFLITCVCSIVLLLVMCYFGINSDSVLKGTAAATIKSCFDPTYILAEDDQYCCPKDKPKLSDNKLLCMTEDYYEKGYCTKDVTVDDETDVDDACNIFYDGVLVDTTTDKETGKITVHCKSYDAHDCGAVGSAYSINETVTDPSVKACYSCSSGFVWGSVIDYDGGGCELKKEYKDEEACLANNIVEPVMTISKTVLSIETGKVATFTVKSNVAGKFEFSGADTSIATVSPSSVTVSANEEKTITVTAISDGTTKVNVTFTSSSDSNTVTKTVNVYTRDPQCWQCSSPDTLFYWGASGPENSTQCQGEWHEARYNKEDCKSQKVEPIVLISPLSLNIVKGKTGTITLQVNTDMSSDGTFSITSGNTSVATVSDSSFKLTMGNSKKITVTGVAKGTTDITIKFTPDDSNYQNFTKTVKVTVTESSGTSDGGTSGGTNQTEYTFTATFNPGSGASLNGKETLTCISYLSNLCTLDSSYSIPTATKSGHTFTGWDTSTSCSSPLKSNLKMTSRSVTYNACFTKNNNNNVDSNGNVTTNSPTGDIVIGVIWFFGIFAIAYAVVNFRRTNEN